MIKKSRIIHLNSLTWLLLIACSAIPVAVTSMPPLTDLGGHLGRYAVQIAPHDPHFAKWYTFKWGLIPNLGVDLLMQVLAPQFGLERSLWYVVLCIPMLQTVGVLALSRAAHGKIPPTALFAVPLVFSYPFMFGFLNFTLGLGLALCAAAAWIWLDRRHQGRIWTIAFGPVALVLWVCHFAAWALFAALALSSSCQKIRGTFINWPRSVLNLIVVLSPIAIPPVVTLVVALFPAESGSGHGGLDISYDFLAKLGMLIMPFRDRWMVWDVGSALLVLGFIGWTLRSTLWKFDAVLMCASVLIGLGYLISPTGVVGLWYVDLRIIPILLVMLLLAARPSDRMAARTRGFLVVTGIAFAMIRCALTTQSLHLSDLRWQREIAMLDHVPVGSTMITLVHESSDNDFNWLRERRQHLSGYGLVRRHIYSNDQWVVPGGQLLRVINKDAGPFITDPSQRVHTGLPGEPDLDEIVAAVPKTIPYLWIIGVPPSFHSTGWHQIANIDDVRLYRATNSANSLRSRCSINPSTGGWFCAH